MKRNLREDIARMVYPMNVVAVDELREDCRKVEVAFPVKSELKHSFSQPAKLPSRYKPFHVNEANMHTTDEPEEENIEVEEATNQKK